MIRILIADSQPRIRAGLAMRLAIEPDIAIVGEADDGEHAVALAIESQPDIVLMDMDLPRLDGLSATQAIHALAPRTAVIIMTVHADERTRARATAAGAACLLEKSAGEPALLAAVHQAVRQMTDSGPG